MITRGTPLDRPLCLHEAAHAVTAEVLRPGCVIGIEMDCLPGRWSRFSGLFAAGMDAWCVWTLWPYSDPDAHVAIAAGREGEKIAEYEEGRFDDGDQRVLRDVATALQRRAARRRAASLVREHELAIRRVAKAVGEKRWLRGDEIRAAILL